VRNMKAKFYTLGCKVNQYESEAMLKQLADHGISQAKAGEKADIVVVNSCTVTAQSDQKVRQVLRRARRENPEGILVLSGCMVQAFPQISQDLLEADIVMGNTNRRSLMEHITTYLSTKQRIIDIRPHEAREAFEPLSVDGFSERTRAFLKIEDGCNRFCSYCIIPYARGRVRSKSLEDLKGELKVLAENGYREVVLTGINLSCYGQDIGLHLCDAVEAACQTPGILRVRLGSLEPEQLSEDVILRLSRQEKLCPQFHLSLQSGCDATLKRMNRHYDSQEYRKIVKDLRHAFPNAAITTDVMVGFPGETEEEFQASLKFVQEIAFAKVHVFAYSKRPGTKAFDMEGQLTKKCKEERSHQMAAAASQLQEAFYRSQIGLETQVLVEREKKGKLLEGYTANYTPVLLPAEEDARGKVVRVKIVSVQDGVCLGELLPQ
jgi:threonylcarbamoyladenosine tRNA methylthiotransferase MtaB